MSDLLPIACRRGRLIFVGCVIALIEQAIKLIGYKMAVRSKLYLKRFGRIKTHGLRDPLQILCLSWQYMGLLQGVNRDKLDDNYSHFVIAGGPIGAVHPKFAAWHKAYWDNLDITVSLHHIKRVVALTHRDCGAAKLAFGDDKVSNKDVETASHSDALKEFRSQVIKRQPKLSVITGIMDLNGRVDLIG